MRLRATKEDATPRYIDYDPNLPPAAFPTLDRPRASEPHTLGDQPNDDDGVRVKVERRSSGSLNDSSPATTSDDETNVQFEDIPMNLIDNYIASNGDLNRIYVDNMARMAAAGHSSSDDGEMEFSESEDGMISGRSNGSGGGTGGKPASVTCTPAWNHLSERMQVEIFDNMLQRYSWPSVCRMLGLTTEERETIQQLLIWRGEQIEFEDLQLKVMRAKQLKDLLKIDNSSGKRDRVPHQLVFRKISRQAAREVREAIEMDFLACEASELAAAKRFLGSQSIDTKFAGDWNNDIVLIETADEEPDSETNRLQANLDGALPMVLTSQTSKQARASRVKQDIGRRLPPAAERAVMNTSGFPNTDGTLEQLQDMSDSSSTPGQLGLLFKGYNERERIQSLNMSIKELSVRDFDSSCVQPEKLYLRTPPLDYHFPNELSSGLEQLDRTPSADLGTGSLAFTANRLGKRPQRVNSKDLSIGSETLSQMSRPPSTDFQKRIEETFQHVQKSGQTRGRATDMEDNPDNPHSDFSGLVKTPVFIRLQPSTPSGTGASPTESENAIFAFLTLGSPIMVTSDATPSLADSSGDTNGSEPTEISTPAMSANGSEHCFQPIDMSKPQETCDNSHFEDEDEDEDEEEHDDDEVVLVPHC